MILLLDYIGFNAKKMSCLTFFHTCVNFISTGVLMYRLGIKIKSAARFEGCGFYAVCVRPGLGVLYLCYDSLECCRVVEGQVGKNLAVDFYA